ncbi:MAG: Crp/Fnr family transcriptional regulator [Sphingobacteriia bacterium]|nr:Crp/Fnr family transcriptional regulator [Sphingobacteriia bacterium]
MQPLEKLLYSIEPIVSLNKDEITTLCSVLSLLSLKRDEYLLAEGQVCDFIGFVNTGVLIYFKTKESGDEVTTDFAFEGDWVNVNLSRLANVPSTLSIRAIEECEVVMLKQKDLNDLYQRIPKLERLGRILTEQAYINIVDQTVELQIHSAKERYENLLKRHPKLLQKVPLYHIANYLGIAPKSLSRIRKEIFE